jgi:4-carboxymuconolactone decarboxylase
MQEERRQGRLNDQALMARISLIEERDHPELAGLIAKIRAGRRGALINVYKLLLHAPPLAEIWLALINAFRTYSVLDARLREIAIIRIGHLNRVDYVVSQHVPQLAVPAGLTIEECAALASPQAAATFGASEQAAIAYVDAMTRHVQVPDDVFARLRACFDQRQIVELTVLIGTYNMHTRVVAALGIDPEPLG